MVVAGHPRRMNLDSPKRRELNEGVRDARCVRTLMGTRSWARCRSLPWRSGPRVVILPAFLAARHGAWLAGRSLGPPAPTAPTQAWRHPAAVAGGPPGRRRRRAARRAVVPARRPGGRHLQDRGRRQHDLLLGPLGALGFCQPDGTFITSLESLASGCRRWPRSARRSWWMGWPLGCSDPVGGPTRRSCTTPNGTPTPPRALPSRPSTATCYDWTGAGRATVMSTSSSTWQGWTTFWTRSRSPACWTAGSAGWPRPARTGMCRSAIAASRTASATPSGRSTACRRGCTRWWSSRSPIWPMPGRCAAGAGCCTASATSSAPLGADLSSPLAAPSPP
jgi:hypothetical protein